MSANRRFLLARRPNGRPVPEDCALVETPGHATPMPPGGPVREHNVGQVHTSAHPIFAAGDWIMGTNAIEDFSIVGFGLSSRTGRSVGKLILKNAA